MKTLLRLWLIASACWAGTAYWALTSTGDTQWKEVAFGPPLTILALIYALRWAFMPYRAGS